MRTSAPHHRHCRAGVSNASVAILALFAGLSMPAFIALGDGLANIVTQQQRAASQREDWGGAVSSDRGEVGRDYHPRRDNWSGNESVLFSVARPGTTPWENQQITAPESFTNSASDFGAWSIVSVEVESQPSRKPSLTQRRFASHSVTYDETLPSQRGDWLRSLWSDNPVHAWFQSRFGASSWTTGASDAHAEVRSDSDEPTASAPMDASEAIDTILENYDRLIVESYGTLPTGVSVSLSLNALQGALENDDPRIREAAELLLADRTLRQSATQGDGHLSSTDLDQASRELGRRVQDAHAWLAGGTALEPAAIDRVIKDSNDGNPPEWARNTAYVLAADFDLLADSSEQGGSPRISRTTLESIAEMDASDWPNFLDSRGEASHFEFEQVQSAAHAALESGLFDYLDAPPDFGVNTNQMVGRELLLSFYDEGMRQDRSWAAYLQDDNASEASYRDLRKEDGANALDGEPLVMRSVERPLFETELVPYLSSPIARIEPEQVVQGALGDCWIMSVLAAYAQAKPWWIRNVIKENPDGTFTVSLRLAGETTAITVDGELATSPYDESGGTLFAQADDEPLWAALIEKALSEVLDGRNGFSNDMMALDGGQEHVVHEMLSRGAVETVYFSEVTSMNATADFRQEQATDASVVTDPEAIMNQLEHWLGQRRAITATTIGDPTNAAIVENVLTSGHSYTVMEINEDGSVLLRDPRGSETRVSQQSFSEAFVSMTSS